MRVSAKEVLIENRERANWSMPFCEMIAIFMGSTQLDLTVFISHSE